MILLEEGLFRRIVEHAERESPKEACGILAGDIGEGKVVKKVYECGNVDPSPSTHYTIDPKEQLEILEEIDGSGTELIGFYHSHPQGPELPSDVDSGRAAWSGYSHVIISLAPGVSITSWIPEEGEGFVKEDIKIVEENYKSCKGD